MKTSKKKKEKQLEPMRLPYSVLETITLTKDQKNLLEIFDDWYTKKKYKKIPVLRLGGTAGTGKSTMIQYICMKYEFSLENALFVGYTGQSVNVLRQLGIPASTIHSTFMHPEKLPVYDKNGKEMKNKDGIPITKVKWVPVQHISSNIKIIIGDEWSFVPNDLEDLILKYNCPVVVFGDPLQLPPVHGESRFREDTVHYLMTDIMRQAKDSEIIDLATRIREGDKIKPWKYQDEVRFLKYQDTIEDTFNTFYPFFKHSDVVVTVTNRQRQAITDLYRTRITKAEGPYPEAGEPLICRKNNWAIKVGPFPLTTGTMGYAINTVASSDIRRKYKVYYLDFQPDYITGDYFGNLMCDDSFLLKPFGKKDDIDAIREAPGAKIEYAYAVTTHLMQGSSADNVLFMDQWMGDKEYMRRLRYTAVTRARKYLVYIRKPAPWER